MQPHDCLCDVDVGVGNVQNNIYDSHSNSLQQKRTEHFQLVKTQKHNGVRMERKVQHTELNQKKRTAKLGTKL